MKNPFTLTFCVEVAGVYLAISEPFKKTIHLKIPWNQRTGESLCLSVTCRVSSRGDFFYIEWNWLVAVKCQEISTFSHRSLCSIVDSGAAPCSTVEWERDLEYVYRMNSSSSLNAAILLAQMPIGMIWCQRCRWFFKFNFSTNRLKGAIVNIHFYCSVSHHILLVRLQYILSFSWNVRPLTFSNFLVFEVCIHMYVSFLHTDFWSEFMYLCTEFFYIALCVCGTKCISKTQENPSLLIPHQGLPSTCRFICVS